MKTFTIIPVIFLLLLITGCAKSETRSDKENPNDNLHLSQTSEITDNLETAQQEDTKTIDSSDWATYENTKYKYTFKHPPESRVGSNEYATEANMASSIDVQLFNEKTTFPQWMAAFNIEVQDSELFSNDYPYMDFDLDDFANKIWEFNKNDTNANFENKKIGDLTKIVVSGQDAYTFTLTNYFQSDRVGYVLNEEYLYILTNDGKYNYILWYPVENQYSSEILNSFSFIK